MLLSDYYNEGIEQFLISFNAKPTSRKTKLPATGTNPYQYTNDTSLPLQSKVSKVQFHHNSEASLLLCLLN